MRSQIGCLALLIPLSLMISACALVPSRVTYSKYSAQSADQPDGTLFRIRRSLLLIKANEATGDIEITSAPTEKDVSGNFTDTYVVTGTDNLISTTQVTSTYLSNTKLFDEVTVTTTDNVGDTISKIGDLAKAAIPLLATAVSGTAVPPDKSFTPTVVDPLESGITDWHRDELNKNYCIRVRNSVVESSLTMSEYVSQGGTRHTLPVAACASATIDLTNVSSGMQCPTADAPSAPVKSFQVTYADGIHVTPIRLPSSGIAKMDGVCGASVTLASKQDRAQLLSYLTGAMTQAEAALNAWKTAKAAQKKAGGQ